MHVLKAKNLIIITEYELQHTDHACQKHTSEVACDLVGESVGKSKK